MSPSNTAYTPHRTFIKFINCKEKKTTEIINISMSSHFFRHFFPIFYFLSSSHWICLGLFFFYYIQLPCYFNPKIKRQVPQTASQNDNFIWKIFENIWVFVTWFSHNILYFKNILWLQGKIFEFFIRLIFIWEKKPINCRHQTFVIKSTGKEIKKIKTKQLVIQYTCNTHGIEKKSLLFLFHLQMHHLGIYDANQWR